MRNSFLRLFAAGLVTLTIAGCVETSPTASTTPAAAPTPVADNGNYVARQDGTFTIPAIPLEKVPPQYLRQTVDYPTTEAPGTVIIDTAQRYLYFVTGKNTATRYGIAVGKAGFEWSGIANVADRKPWPTWTPPPEMIERKPELAKWAGGQPGGLTNPLGARAIYLKTNGVDYGYRIHGTPEWQSIGRNASSGCIRMINQDVIDLYGRVPDGAKVIVLTHDGKVPTKLNLPSPAPKKVAKAEPPRPQPSPVADPVVTPAADTAPAVTDPSQATPTVIPPVNGRV
ncbi:MAG: L,D-transpeptidase [Cereibacter sphaeroides]|uniref:L,D-transpeptidase n=1 Tax=Cereibacter sphaeroides TaxID=1063 RepID=A0A2W5U138_CERSP|nr:MAG: L,D-transpeptidase [Cereibacter sphaeroides]